jgi:growth hormone-inducible transmembrane protein
VAKDGNHRCTGYHPIPHSSYIELTEVTQAGVAVSVVVIDGFLNRQTRDGLSTTEQAVLHDTFKYTGGGLVLTAIAARSIFKSGFAFRIMSANPWLVLGVSLVGSIGTMMGTYYTPPEKTIQKHLFWLGFNACQAATLSPLFLFSPAILSRAALYTVGIVGSLSYVGATAKYICLRPLYLLYLISGLGMTNFSIWEALSLPVSL